MPLKVNANEYAEKWARNLKNARTDVERGINRVDTAPGVKAAQAQDKFRAGILEAIESGRWKQRVASVSLEDWKQKTLSKGLQRIDTGVDQAIRKVEQIAQTNLANIEAVKNEIDKLPSTTFADRIQRMVRFSEGMHRRSKRA